MGGAWVVHGDGAWVHACCVGLGKGGCILLGVEIPCYTLALPVLTSYPTKVVTTPRESLRENQSLTEHQQLEL